MQQALSREWLDANMSRAYPLDDLTGGVAGTLPCNVFVDCFVLTSGIDDPELFISKVNNTGRSIILSINVNGIVFDDAIAIHEVEDYSSVEFNKTVDSVTIAGTITIGSYRALSGLKTQEYTKTQTKLAPYIVRPIDSICVTGIKVGDKLLTGDVILEAGEGISLDVVGNEIHITANNYQPPSENLSITSDAQLVANIVNTYGMPVLSIAGVTPDTDGAIYINEASRVAMSDVDGVAGVVEGNADYVVAETMDAPGVLRLKLNRDPQLELDAVKALTNNAMELDIRSSRIDKTISAIDTVVGSLATQLTRLD